VNKPRAKACTKCDCGLYQVFVGEDDEPTKIECNMCGAEFPIKRLTLTLNHADLIGVIMRGVSGNAKLNWYQFGGRDADHPLTMVMRAFTHDGGGFLSEKDDIRDAYVWCSGFTERWFKVTDLIEALDNLDGKHGDTNPIATIE
jgi:hypothetical protein